MKPIGKLAQSLNLNVETIRFYEREGLITQPEKPISGYRQYDETIAGQLGFITKAKALGFTLREIKSLMSKHSSSSPSAVFSIASNNPSIFFNAARYSSSELIDVSLQYVIISFPTEGESSHAAKSSGISAVASHFESNILSLVFFIINCSL